MSTIVKYIALVAQKYSDAAKVTYIPCEFRAHPRCYHIRPEPSRVETELEDSEAAGIVPRMAAVQ